MDSTVDEELMLDENYTKKKITEKCSHRKIRSIFCKPLCCIYVTHSLSRWKRIKTLKIILRGGRLFRLASSLSFFEQCSPICEISVFYQDEVPCLLCTWWSPDLIAFIFTHLRDINLCESFTMSFDRNRIVFLKCISCTMKHARSDCP